MSRRILFALAAFGCVWTGASAADPLVPPDLSRYLRWGPVRVRPGFAIPTFGYDDNVFSLGDARQSRGDFVVRLSPRAEGVVLFGRSAFLTFKEQLDYTAYESYHTLNHFENLGSARVTFPLRRMGFFVDGALNRLKDPTASELASRPIRRERKIGAGALLKFGWRTEAELGLIRSQWRHQDPDFLSPEGLTAGQLLNRTDTGAQVKLRYRLTGTTRLGLDTIRRRIRFDDPQVERDTDETILLTGVELGEGGRLVGTIRVGWDRLDPASPAEPEFSGIIGDARVALRFAGAVTLRLDAARRAGFALYQGNRYYQETSYEAHVVRYLNRVFGVEVGGGNGRLSFPAAAQGGERIDRAWKADAALRVRLPESLLGRRAEYSIGVVHRRRDSTVPGLSLSRNLFAIAADIGF